MLPVCRCSSGHHAEYFVPTALNPMAAQLAIKRSKTPALLDEWQILILYDLRIFVVFSLNI
jgi:hypothetical protein